MRTVCLGQTIVKNRKAGSMQNFKDSFSGYYYKHQKGSHTLCLIAGKSNTGKFIQVITENFSAKVPFTNGNSFSEKGIVLDIQTPEFSLTGKIRYWNPAPIRYDIMGPFRFFPMECRHGIVSMCHDLDGKVILNGEEIDFTEGKGYIEKDSGCSFPSSYTWIQANDFPVDCSVMAAVAEIPFCGLRFQGCICVIHYYGREYRLATYLGVQVVVCTEREIILKQGRYRLVIRVEAEKAYRLKAPRNGKMSRTIAETAACPAEFAFFKGKQLVFRLNTQHASFENEK